MSDGSLDLLHLVPAIAVCSASSTTLCGLAITLTAGTPPLNFGFVLQIAPTNTDI